MVFLKAFTVFAVRAFIFCWLCLTGSLFSCALFFQAIFVLFDTKYFLRVYYTIYLFFLLFYCLIPIVLEVTDGCICSVVCV